MRLMFLIDAPAPEDRHGRLIVGKPGQELSRYLKSIGLSRSDIFLTSILKQRPIDHQTLTKRELDRDFPLLLREINQYQPDVIVTIGRTPTSYILEDNDILMDDVHGVPMHGKEYSHEYRPVIFPILHPFSGMYNSELQIDIQSDFFRLYDLLAGRIQPQQHFDRVWHSLSLDLLPAPVIAIDTEGSVASPWCLSVSSVPGEAFVVMSDDRDGLGRLRDYLRIHDPLVVLHYALHDLPVLRAMGIDNFRYTDTMVLAYLLGTEPQGLKALAFRHLGLRMVSYEDVVRDAECRISEEYIYRFWEEAACTRCLGDGKVKMRKKNGKGWKKNPEKCPDCEGDGTLFPPPEEQLIFKDGQLKFYQPQGIGRRVRGIIKDIEEGKEVDVRKRWEDIDESIRDFPQAVVGSMPPTTLSDVDDPAEPVRYAALDAEVTLRIHNKLMEDIMEEGLDRVLELDLGRLPMIDRMIQVGMKIDRQWFEDMDKELTKENQITAAKIEALTGKYINPSSSKQVGEWLYHERGIDCPKQTKTGQDATSNDVLSGIQIRLDKESAEYQFIGHVLDYRERHKLLGTYIRGIPACADEHDRVHTTFKYTRTATGRLSSADPNLQNIPARTETGMRIRGGFVAEEGRMLYAADYAQIEIRVAAHLSGDPTLIQAIRDGLDIHTATAARVFKWPGGYEGMLADLAAGNKDAKFKRTMTKNLVFGVLYRISAKGLKAQMDERGEDVTEAECEDMIRAFFDTYPGIKDFMDRTDQFLEEQLYVVDMFGRRRWLPGVQSCVEYIRAEAYRQGGNFPFQSSAGGILELAMIEINNNVLPVLRKIGWIEPVCQVHDELIFEHEIGMEEVVDREITAAMERVIELDVPIPAEGNSGKRWMELK